MIKTLITVNGKTIPLEILTEEEQAAETQKHRRAVCEVLLRQHKTPREIGERYGWNIDAIAALEKQIKGRR